MRSLLPGKIDFLTLLFLSSLQMALGKNNSETVEQRQHVNGVNQSVPCENNTTVPSTVSQADSLKMSQPISESQTPNIVEVTESSTLIMNCSFQINVKIWYIKWFKNGTEGPLDNTSRISIITDTQGNSHLILNKAEVEDSGIYTCIVFGYQDHPFLRTGNNLTVNAITDLMVNQTPEQINQTEGTNVTLECRFKTVSDYNFTVVRWFRDQEKLDSARDSLRIELDRERGFTSLSLIKAAVNDSGDYRCEVESKSRKLTGSGKASRVTITTVSAAPGHHTEHNNPQGNDLATIGVGAGAGVAILLLVATGVIMWKRRSKKSRSEPEISPAKESGLHPPLVHQASEVTYADLHFHKKEVKPDAEVVYAEVRTPRKQQTR